MSDTLTSTATAQTSDIPDYPMAREPRCPFAPPPDVMALAEARPMSRVRIWDGSTPWLITGYEQVRELFSDSRVSVDDRQPGFPHWNEGMLSTVHKRPRSVFTADGEEHTRFRRMLSKPFTFKRVENLRPTIQQITDDHIDAILAGPQPADIVTALALPVPSLVISQLLGVPYEDADMFQHHANVGLARYATGEDTVKGAMSLNKYLAQLVEAKMENPAEDAVSDLAERVKAGELSVKEAAQLGTGLLIAGHETTSNMIGLGVLALLENPDQLAVIRDAEDPKVVASAVEELLRYLSIIQNGQRRVALETSTSPVRRSVPARASSSIWPRPTGMRTRSPNRTAYTCTARAPTATSPSATGGISAWDNSWPAPSCRLSSIRWLGAFPRCDLPFRSRRFRSKMTDSPTASTNCR